MLPVKFWLRTIQIGKKKYKPISFFRCEIYLDRLKIFNNDEEILTFLIKDIQRVKIKFSILFTAYRVYDVLSLRDRLEKISLEPINPIYPNVITNINYRESKKLKTVINDLKKYNKTSVESNPYVRNKKSMKFIKNIDDLDLNLQPEDFYTKYVKSNHKLSIFLAFAIPVIIIILGYIIDYLLNR